MPLKLEARQSFPLSFLFNFEVVFKPVQYVKKKNDQNRYYW